MKKLGFLINNVGPNQLAYQLISTANQYLVEKDDADPIIFYRQLSPFVLQPKFACVNMFEAYAYEGLLVTTDLSGTARALEWPGPNRHDKIYYYVNDLDWIRIPNKHYEQIEGIYLSEKVELIARSDLHYKLISSIWKQPYGIVEHGNFEDFVELLYPNLK